MIHKHTLCPYLKRNVNIPKRKVNIPKRQVNIPKRKVNTLRVKVSLSCRVLFTLSSRRCYFASDRLLLEGLRVRVANEYCVHSVHCCYDTQKSRCLQEYRTSGDTQTRDMGEGDTIVDTTKEWDGVGIKRQRHLCLGRTDTAPKSAA